MGIEVKKGNDSNPAGAGRVPLSNGIFRDVHLQWHAESDDDDGGDSGDGKDGGGGSDGGDAGGDGGSGKDGGSDGSQGGSSGKSGEDLPALYAGATGEQRKAHADYLRQFSKMPELIDEVIRLKERSESGLPARPGKDATAEAVAEYRKSAGIPEKPEDYQLGAVPQGLEKDPVMEKWFRETVHANMIPQDQAAILYDSWNQQMAERVAGIMEERKATAKATEAALRKEYGSDYSANMALKQRVLNMGGPGLWEYLEKTGLGNSLELSMWVVEVGKLISEDRLGGNSSLKGPGRKSTAEIMYGKDKE